MKKIGVLPMLLILILALTACANGAESEPQDNPDPENEELSPEGEDMVFDEEDVSEPEGFDFSDEDIPEGDAPDVEEDPGMVFTEDEVEEIPDESDEILPPVGESTWQITHEDGTTNCSIGSISFGEDEIETIKMEVSSGPDQFAMLIHSPDETDFIALQRDFGNPVAEYVGEWIIPGTEFSLVYQIFFDNLEGGSVANYMYGTISSTAGGCLTTRDFTGVPVE